MTELKPSQFNIEFRHNGLHYLYNSKTTMLAKIEKPLCECIIDNTYRDTLLQNGFLVEDSMNEVEVLLNEIDEKINQIPDTLEMTVVLTEACNFQCVYCYQTKNSREFSEDDSQELLRKLNVLFDKGLKNLFLHYFGGEPLLNLPALRLLDESIKRACLRKNVNFKSYITTNGSLLTKEVLKEFNFNTIQLTFDGNVDTHGLYKVSKTFTYKDLLNTVDMVLRESSSDLRIRFNICKENAGGFISTLDDLFALQSFDNMRVNFAFNQMRNFSETDKFTELSPEDYSKVNLQLRKHVLSLGKPLILPRAAEQPCKFAVGNAICIGSKCKSYFCTTSFDTASAKSSVEDFLDKKNIHYEVPEICKSCVVLPVCLCSCKLLNPEKNACIPEKYIIVELLKMYLDGFGRCEL